MFDGLMSRWTMPRSWACAIACALSTMCGISASRSPSVPALPTSFSSGRPDTLRIT
jgi:hypothetical protein